MIQRNDLFSYAAAPTVREVTDRAIAAATDHADQERPGWADDALDHFRQFAADHPAFMSEDVRAWAYDRGLDRPPAEGAWGNVARRARKAGIVAPRGFASSKNPSQHGKQMTVWESQVFGSGLAR